MNSYKVLNNQVFESGDYSIVPIRYEDRLDIMKWRNEQIYHLRQSKPLTLEDQEKYFEEVVSNLFNQDRPNQILFSYLQGNQCIGYGGLVHINWIDKYAEISFIMDTKLEAMNFEFHWQQYLLLIEQVAFNELGLHKIFTYAYDLRPRLYIALQAAGFKEEARLKEHCYFNGGYIDVLIHSKIDQVTLRKAHKDDVKVTYSWANDPITRKYSFNKDHIPFENHVQWFNSKIKYRDCIYLILENSLRSALGSIRLDVRHDTALISYLIAPVYHGRGLGRQIVTMAEQYMITHYPVIQQLEGYVMEENVASIKIFERLNYIKQLTSEGLKFRKSLYENR